MTINLDSYMNLLDCKNKEALERNNLISIIKKSKKFKYNPSTGKISYYKSPKCNTIVVPLHSIPKQDLIYMLNRYNRYINNIMKNSTHYIISLVNEHQAYKILDLLKYNGIFCKLEIENLKEKVLGLSGKKGLVVVKDYLNNKNDRKISDEYSNIRKGSNRIKDIKYEMRKYTYNCDDAHKYSYNKFDYPYWNNDYESKSTRKSSYTSYPLNKDYEIKVLSETKTYSFQELSKMFFNMKLLKKFNFPQDWSNLSIDEIINKDMKPTLDHFKENKRSIKRRERAWTNYEGIVSLHRSRKIQ